MCRDTVAAPNLALPVKQHQVSSVSSGDQHAHSSSGIPHAQRLAALFLRNAMDWTDCDVGREFSSRKQ